MSIRVYVGNLPKELEAEEFEAVFADAGEGVSAKLVTDRKTDKSRGFGFVTCSDDAQAEAVIEKYNGFQLKETQLKLEKANPRDSKPAGDRGGDRRSSGGAGRRPAVNRGPRVISSDPVGEAGPDPRWASELEKLKELLAAAQV